MTTGYQPKPQPLSTLFQGTLPTGERTILANAGNSTASIRNWLFSSPNQTTLTIWREHYNPAANYNVLSISDQGIVLGDTAGGIHLTQNYGASWTTVFQATSEIRWLNFCPDTNTLWAACADGKLYKNVDHPAEEPWTLIGTFSFPLTGVATSEYGDVCVIGADRRITVSHDNGDTWAHINSPHDVPHLSVVYCTTAQAFVVAAASKKLYRGTSRGVTWTDISAALPLGSGVKVMAARNDVICAHATTGAEILRSTDAGTTWSSAASTSQAEAYAMAHDRAGNWLCAEYTGDMWLSADEGATWTQHSTDLQETVWAITYDNGNWLLAQRDRILRSADSLATFNSGIDAEPWTLHIDAWSPTFIPMNYLIDQRTSLVAQPTQDIFALLLT